MIYLDRCRVARLRASAEWLAARLAVHVSLVPDEEIRESAAKWVEFQDLATPELVMELCSHWLDNPPVPGPDFMRWIR